MSIKIRRTGNFDKLKKNLKKLDGSHQVKLTDLMNESFISTCSNFSSLEDLFNASGFKFESQEDFEAIPDDEWDEFITNNTTYKDWSEMKSAASAEYAKTQLFKGLK